MLTVKNLSISFGVTRILKGISLDVGRGEVLIVAGANGSGKSTLLNCIAGTLEPSSGSIHMDGNFALLPQKLISEKGSVTEFLLSASPRISDAYRKINATEPESMEHTRALAEFTDASGYELQAELERFAGGFGFDREDLARPMATFSEGQKQLFAIIRSLASPARLLLMDEPLNHLDISMCIYFEEVILREKKKGRGFLVVTHDRVFADRVADRTLFIQRGKGITVHGGYSQMIAHLELEFESRKKRAGDINRKIRKLEREVTSRKIWSARREADKIGAADKGFISARAARMAKRAKAAEHRQERMIKRLEEEKPFVEKKLKLSFKDYRVVNRRVVSASGIAKSFGDDLILEDVNLVLRSKERIALIGPNGSGKTTLFRCLLGELEVDKGEVRLSEHVNCRYLPQDVQSAFERKILLDNLTSNEIEESKVRQCLGAAKLRREKVLQPIPTLSRGELMRAWIVGAILAKAEFLFLDEPTNHLDIESLTVLDGLLENFPGGMFFISHNRHFIAQHAEEVFSIQDKTLVPYGNF